MGKALEKRLSEFLLSRGRMVTPSENADELNRSGKPWLKLWSLVNVDPAECDLEVEPDWWYRSFDAVAFGDLNVMPPWPSLFGIERERFRDFAPSSEEELDIMLTARGVLTVVVPKWPREENSEEWCRRAEWIDSRLLSPVGVRLHQADRAERERAARAASSPGDMFRTLGANTLAKRTTSDPRVLFLPSGSIGNFWRSAKETVIGGSEDSVIRSLPVCAFIADLKPGPQLDLSSGCALPWWMRVPSVVDSLAGVSSGEEFDIITAAFG